MDTIFAGSMTMSFAARLIALRKHKKLTQQDLADATGIHVQQIKRYEAGTSEPASEALRKLARTLRVSADALLFEEGERGPDDELRLQFDAIARMPKKDKQFVQEVLDSLLLKYEAKRLISRAAG